MLVNMNTVLGYAEERGCAIAAFDTPNLEILLAVIDAAEKRNEPVIIQHAQLHEDVTHLDVIGPIMMDRARKALVPVCPMLDHATNTGYVQQALDIGFTAIMYDGSGRPYEDNVAATRDVVAMCHAAGVDVEAEIGVTYGHEGNQQEDGGAGNRYTDPELAQRFVADTGIDALAASFGTVHGFYRSKPKLDFERITRIRELVGIPLVMHGGSGLSREDTRRSIECGIRKINYFSYMSHAGVEGVRRLFDEGDPKLFHELANAAQAAMEVDAENAMEMFSMK